MYPYRVFLEQKKKCEGRLKAEISTHAPSPPPCCLIGVGRWGSEEGGRRVREGRRGKDNEVPKSMSQGPHRLINASWQSKLLQLSSKYFRNLSYSLLYIQLITKSQERRIYLSVVDLPFGTSFFSPHVVLCIGSSMYSYNVLKVKFGLAEKHNYCNWVNNSLHHFGIMTLIRQKCGITYKKERD